MVSSADVLAPVGSPSPEGTVVVARRFVRPPSPTRTVGVVGDEQDDKWEKFLDLSDANTSTTWFSKDFVFRSKGSSSSKYPTDNKGSTLPVQPKKALLEWDRGNGVERFHRYYYSWYAEHPAPLNIRLLSNDHWLKGEFETGDGEELVCILWAISGPDYRFV